MIIKAKHLKEGMSIVYSNFNLYVDCVEYTRDGQVKVSIGIDGTGTQFFDMNDRVTVE